MNKSERLLQILTYLRSRRTPVTAETLADRLGVSARTIYRDMQSLALSGVPVESEAGIGYLLEVDSSIVPLMFTEAEIEALMLGARLIRAWGDDGMVAAAEQALTKIRAVIPEKTMRRLSERTTPFLVPSYSRQERVKFGDTIRAAIGARKLLELTYVDVNDSRTERRVEPLGLIFWGAAWTLVAWCLLRHDYRTFRLDRIEKVAMSEQAFAADNGHSLKAYIEQYDPCVDTQFWS